ncbi:hypothetical protein [Yunchengibacter salinarum]|uniref:hypothetical protein n=1 Tax=Yunchengibacter salinarum TaxID=3133399 RepID=UPI0035B699C9
MPDTNPLTSPAVKTAINHFYDRLITDPELAPVFARADTNSLKRKLHWMLATLVMEGRSDTADYMSRAHARLRKTGQVTPALFERFTCLLDESLKAADVSDVMTAKLVGAARSLKDIILHGV